MSRYRHLIIFCFFIVIILSHTETRAENPEYIHITYEPCYIGCDYAFPYCYGYKIFNINDAIRIKNWETEGDLIKGRAVVNVNGKVTAKLCYQVSLNNKDYLLNDELNLEAEFDFIVKMSEDTPGGNFDSVCINYEESRISYSSFTFKGDLLKKPYSFFPEIEKALTYEMELVFADSLYRAVYDSLSDNLPEGKEKRKNIYCDGEQADSGSDKIACGCN